MTAAARWSVVLELDGADAGRNAVCRLVCRLAWFRAAKRCRFGCNAMTLVLAGIDEPPGTLSVWNGFEMGLVLDPGRRRPRSACKEFSPRISAIKDMGLDKNYSGRSRSDHGLPEHNSRGGIAANLSRPSKSH